MARERIYEPERPQVQFRIPSDILRRLTVEAQRRRVSKTMLLEILVKDGLPKLEKQKLAV